LEAIEKVPPECGPDTSLLFPLFSAGVEASGSLRRYALFRMTYMEKYGIMNVRRAKEVILETWRRRENNGLVKWEEVIDEMWWDM